MFLLYSCIYWMLTRQYEFFIIIGSWLLQECHILKYYNNDRVHTDRSTAVLCIHLRWKSQRYEKEQTVTQATEQAGQVYSSF